MPFPVDIQDLSKLHQEQGLEQLAALGGTPGVAASLKVDLDKGIASSEEAERQTAFGVNQIPEKQPKSYLAYLCEALEDFTMRLLCVCAVLQLVIAFAFHLDEDPLSFLEGTAILLTVVAVINIQAMQDWSKERSFREQSAVSNNTKMMVLRDGCKLEISRYDLVVGDIIAVSVGDILEADGILLQGADIEVDESALTGEPEDIKKDPENNPFLFSGTAVKAGSGFYLATAVGVNTMSGKITVLVRGQKIDTKSSTNAVPGQESDLEAGIAASEDDQHEKDTVGEEEHVDEEASSVLQEKLDAMVGRIAYFAFGSAGIATTIMLIRYVVDFHINGDGGWDWSSDADRILSAVIQGIAIVVVAVPEGLPLAVTLALTLSMRQMQKDNNLVKHMDATETMGSATTICSDKTGTLTQNRMTVVRAHVGGQEFVGEHSKSATCGKLVDGAHAVSPRLKELLSENICATKADGAEISWNVQADRWDQKGNKTDCALLAFSDDLGVRYEEFRARPAYQVPSRSGGSTFGLKMYTFSSARKRSGHALPLTEMPKSKCRLHVKGASEIILNLCTKEMQLDGACRPIDDRRRKQICNDVVDKFASDAMRTIAVAYRDFEAAPDWEEEVDMETSIQLTGLKAKTFKAETGLTFLGVMGIHDPIREGVPRAITQCNRAGVDVRMVTGDHKATAIAIAKECGILRRGIDFGHDPGETLAHSCTVMTGDDFRSKVLTNGKISQEAFDAVWPHLRVLARSSPEDKYTLVCGLRKSELYKAEERRPAGVHPNPQIVAVTGDGTNDAPALRHADVGFAMQITGTRVAQDAADILLMDDNFESVVKACMWGRNVYDSIAKFLQFQLTVNISAVSISLIGACTVKEAPLSVVQMLWVNLIMDSLGALALASEQPTEDLLERKPYGKNKGLISYEMIWNMLGQSIYQLVVLHVLLFGAAGNHAPLSDPHPEEFDWQKGGFLDIYSGIGRGEHASPTKHYTMIFNCFVFMQLFNWINCRKLQHELNVFSGLHTNFMFCTIWIICVGVQVLLVESASFFENGQNKAFKTVSLSGPEWLLCLCCGFFTMVWYLIIAAVGRSMKHVFKPEERVQTDVNLSIDGDGANSLSQSKVGRALSNKSADGGSSPAPTLIRNLQNPILMKPEVLKAPKSQSAPPPRSDVWSIQSTQA